MSVLFGASLKLAPDDGHRRRSDFKLWPHEHRDNVRYGVTVKCMRALNVAWRNTDEESTRGHPSDLVFQDSNSCKRLPLYVVKSFLGLRGPRM